MNQVEFTYREFIGKVTYVGDVEMDNNPCFFGFLAGEVYLKGANVDAGGPGAEDRLGEGLFACGTLQLKVSGRIDQKRVQCCLSGSEVACGFGPLFLPDFGNLVPCFCVLCYVLVNQKPGFCAC